MTNQRRASDSPIEGPFDGEKLIDSLSGDFGHIMPFIFYDCACITNSILDFWSAAAVQDSVARS
jgi:hypothetical protein